MRLYSTLARGLVDLPQPPAKIGMYVCGPTVYARAHIGNARPYLVGSWYARWLRRRGYEVTLVHNITDVDDKIFVAAPGRSRERADEATAWYLEDVGRFGLEEVDHFPRVTETMDEIVAFIEDLIERDFAYDVEGDVYFRVSRWPEYGRLSGQRPEQVEEQEPNPLKEDPRDFALWKASKPDEDRAWESPWGPGRPGWHIECSAMAEKLLGPAFEIHGGGVDIVFPHHENELAQSKARGHEFAKVWMHNGMLRFTGEKMSKSLGNVETIKEVLDRWGVETTLLFFLTAHWRSPIDFSDETMQSAAAQWRRLSTVTLDDDGPAASESDWAEFATALDDDFNTPIALATLNRWHAQGSAELLTRGLDIFGLPRPRRLHKITLGGSIEPRGEVGLDILRRKPVVWQKVMARLDARRNRDFALSDQLRAELEREGIEFNDRPDESDLLVPE